MTTKFCPKCEEIKPLDAFNGKKTKAYACRNCANAINRDRYRDGRDNPDSKYRHVYELHLSSAKQWLEDNREQDREKSRKWRKENRAKRNEQAARRRANKINATPKWADEEFDKFLVSEMYDLAKLRTKLTGIEWHVDHKVPLLSKSVCGLHCADNLEVTTAEYNMQKHNCFWPDMWENTANDNRP
jgi:transposase